VLPVWAAVQPLHPDASQWRLIDVANMAHIKCTPRNFVNGDRKQRWFSWLIFKVYQFLISGRPSYVRKFTYCLFSALMIVLIQGLVAPDFTLKWVRGSSV
jgi:hypothetical protein